MADVELLVDELCRRPIALVDDDRRMAALLIGRSEAISSLVIGPFCLKSKGKENPNYQRGIVTSSMVVMLEVGGTKKRMEEREERID